MPQQRRTLEAIALRHGFTLVDIAATVRRDRPLRAFLVRKVVHPVRQGLRRTLDGRFARWTRPILTQLTGVRSNDALREAYRNRSDTCEGTIRLGLYDDAGRRTAAFFHELGHLVNDARRPDWDTRTELRYDDEREAWDTGLHLARVEKYSFEAATILWCDAQLAASIGLEAREAPGGIVPHRNYDPQLLTHRLASKAPLQADLEAQLAVVGDRLKRVPSTHGIDRCLLQEQQAKLRAGLAALLPHASEAAP